MKHWFVLYTKPRNEKKVASQLEKMGLQAYCPLITEIKQWSDRKKKVETPLIPSYIFIQIDSANRDLVFQVPGVVRYLFWLGKPAIVRDNEISILKDWVDGSHKVRVEGIQTGDVMKIETGPFKGQEAMVEQVGENRLQLLLINVGLKVILTKNL